MKMSFSLCLLLLSPLAYCAEDERSRSSVTIPIKEYLEMKEKVEAPPIKSVEEAVLRGSFGKSLEIQFSGASSGKQDKREISEYSDGFALSNCSGDAVLDREGNRVLLVPLSKRFRLNCRVNVPNWNSVEIRLSNVLFFRSEVSGAQAIVDSKGNGDRKIVLVPKTQELRAPAATVTAVGRYQLTALPDEIRFKYDWLLNNPSRYVRDYEISWKNTEVVQEIKTNDTYDEKPGRLIIKLRPGDNQISASGKFSGVQFVPLVPSEQQYLLIESHPLLQLNITTAARRISVSEAGIGPQFANAQVYLFGSGNSFQWKTRKLDLIESLGYSVQNGSYRYYVPQSGQSIVEASFTIENQGTPEIPMEIPGTPTYVEVNRRAEPLYKDPQGRLLVRLPAGRHDVLIQYRGTQNHRGLMTYVGSSLAKPATVLSNVGLDLLMPEKWKLIFGMGLLQPQSDFSFYLFLWALVGGGAAFVFFKMLSFAVQKRIALACIFACAVVLQPAILPWGLGIAVVLVAIHIRKSLVSWIRHRPKLAVTCGSVLGVLVLLIVWNFSNRRLMEKSDWGLTSNIAQSYLGKSQDGPSSKRFQALSDGIAPMAGGLDLEVASNSDTGRSTAYTGVPARIPIPASARVITFSQEFVDRAGSVNAHALFVSTGFLKAIFYTLITVLALILFRNRSLLRQWIQKPV
ncbi:MAG: hypothetical protein HY537_06980 [Deltaproteobacteria bacterium]|nr:hypothetical protein [Deltaproteobacteria bacterium]